MLDSDAQAWVNALNELMTTHSPQPVDIINLAESEGKIGDRQVTETGPGQITVADGWTAVYEPESERWALVPNGDDANDSVLPLDPL
ncbi:MAG TPA: hypothetical protein VE645_11175 [Pseudonocardiaceae bacterium]|jgi:hypothetical protein|nr:hypothetical protein [Pseudonocardiaceae bacterium]